MVCFFFLLSLFLFPFLFLLLFSFFLANREDLEKRGKGDQFARTYSTGWLAFEILCCGETGCCCEEEDGLHFYF